MDKKAKNTIIVSVIALALVLIGVTYAYFSARITGLESASTISLTAGRMGIVYSEGDEAVKDAFMLRILCAFRLRETQRNRARLLSEPSIAIQTKEVIWF